MEFVLLGLNHRTASIEVRERLDFSRHVEEHVLQKLAEAGSVSSGLVLSTCNRVEVYAAGENEQELFRATESLLHQYHDLNVEDVRSCLYRKTNRDAVRHLFRVGSSLDSMIVGEPQILGQVKDAYYKSVGIAFTDPFFDKLIRKTFSVAKRIRTETKIGQQAVSISYAAVELAKKIFGDLSRKVVLVLGAGEMAELAAQHLIRKNVKRVYFSNRTYDHAVELARNYSGIPVSFNQFGKYLREADILIVSTGAPEYLLSRELVESAVEARKQSPMFLIDISVPRNVDPDVHQIENVYLYNIDDLQSVVDFNLKGRRQEAEKAEEIVNAEVDRFYRTIEDLRAAPVIQVLKEKYESVRQREVKRLLGRLGDVPPSLREEVEKASVSIVKKILNDPILFLKDVDADLEDSQRADMLRKIFRLGGLRGGKKKDKS